MPHWMTPPMVNHRGKLLIWFGSFGTVRGYWARFEVREAANS